MRNIAQRVDNFRQSLSDIPQIKRGLCYCHECGRTESISGVNFSTGWPKCCGYTMSLDSPDERAALRSQENDGAN